MNYDLDHLLNRLRSETDRTILFFQNLSPEVHQFVIYPTSSKWTTKDILAHIVASEEGFYELVVQVMSGGDGSPKFFDIDSYNEVKVRIAKHKNYDDLLQSFRTTRLSLISIVSNMVPSDLSKKGRHPYLGDSNLLQIIKLIYRHNKIHQRDINRVLADKDY